MLPEKISKISQADNTVRLLLVCIFFYDMRVYIDEDLPGRVKVTVRVPPPTMKDFDWGSSLVFDEFSGDTMSYVSLCRLNINIVVVVRQK